MSNLYYLYLYTLNEQKRQEIKVQLLKEKSIKNLQSYTQCQIPDVPDANKYFLST